MLNEIVENANPYNCFYFGISGFAVLYYSNKLIETVYILGYALPKKTHLAIEWAKITERLNGSDYNMITLLKIEMNIPTFKAFYRNVKDRFLKVN